MAWRAAKSLLTLHAQLKAGSRAAPPATGAAEWGLIGDVAHDSTSDHAPHDFPGWGSQIVTAADFPNRPDLGLNAAAVLDAIRQSRDSRVKYGISNGHIFSNRPVGNYAAWAWRPYSGSDQHETHGHLSVVGDARADDTRPWQTIGASGLGEADEMALSDTLPGTKSPDHPSTDRTPTEGLADLVTLRLVLIGQKSLKEAGYPDSSPLAQIIAVAKAGPAPTAEVPEAVLDAALDRALGRFLARLGDAQTR